jgi:hypothetical protein
MAQKLPMARRAPLSPEAAAHQAAIQAIKNEGATQRQEMGAPSTAQARPQPRQPARPLQPAPERMLMSSSGRLLGR